MWGGGCYEVTYAVRPYDVSFRAPEVVEGTPLRAGLALTNVVESRLRIRHWVHGGQGFRGETRFGHARQLVPPGEAPPADDNWQLPVVVRVQRLDTRFVAEVAWYGSARTCATGGGSFTIDAPVAEGP